MRRIDLARVAASLITGVLVAAGCAAAAPSPVDEGGSGAAGGGGSGGAVPDAGGYDGAVLDGADFGDGSGNGMCAGEAKDVYVVDYDRRLYRFAPAALTFDEVGELDCAPAQIFSMAVDRNAVAWALAIDGTMIRYDIASHLCSPLSFATGQHGFITFGMGFSSNDKGSADETLFVSSASDLGLATVDTQTLELDPVGVYDQLGGRVELTGTGDGQLFGVFEGSPYVVAEIAKTSAAILSQAPQPDVVLPPGGSNFAFAFWGGDFWLFVGPGGATTDVFRYRPADGTTTKVAHVDFEIVGAGVSTCAPTVPPN